MSDLEKGLSIAVKMVRLYGLEYLPIVDRLRRELENKQATEKLIEEFETAEG